MKIAYCLETTALWGGVKVVFGQAEGLGARGHEVTIMAREVVPSWRPLPCLVEGILSWDRPDLSTFDLIIATHCSQVLALAGKGVPLVQLVQGDDEACAQSDADKALVRKALGLPMPKIAISPELARRMARRYPGPWRWVLQGMDLSIWRPAPRLPDDNRLLVVGPFDGQFHGRIKGMPQGLLAARVACHEHGLCLVRLNQFDQVLEEAVFCEASEYHHGILPSRVPAIYQSCDLFLSSSQPVEGFGLPALEALACGLPAVLSDIPSHRDFDDVDDFALWAPPGDSVGMANRIGELVRDRDLQAHLRRRGPEVASLYEKSRSVTRLESVLKDLVKEAQDRPAIVVCTKKDPASAYYREEEVLCFKSLSDCLKEDETPLHVQKGVLPDAEALLQLADSHRTILVLANGNMISTCHLITGLQAALEADASAGAVGPVSNLAENAQHANVPYMYLNRRNYQALADRYARKGVRAETEVLESFCLLLRVDALKALPKETRLSEIPSALKGKGWKLVVAGDVFIHRFAAQMLDQPREDLQKLVPSEAMHVLDIGCATGEFGKALKRSRPELYVCGIESNVRVAEKAKSALDRVIAEPVEKVSFDRQYDCVVCGELLEHLASPLELLKRLKEVVSPEGCLIASSPCITHWSVIRDLLEGHFEYVPFGILCFEHIHFFTPSSMRALFREAGFQIELEIATRYAEGPEAAMFFEALKGCAFATDHDTFEIAELTILARPE